MPHPHPADHDRIVSGLWVAGIVAVLMALVGVCLGVCWLIGSAYQRNHVLGWAGGIVTILVFFFVVGATADWSD